MKTLFGIIFLLSVLFNVFFFVLDTKKFLYSRVVRRLKRRKQTVEYDTKVIETSIAQSAKRMFLSNRTFTIWNEKKSVTEDIFYFIKRQKQRSIITYHYPKAFLFYAVAVYYKYIKNSKGINDFQTVFNRLLNNDGTPTFTLSIVDQVPFGLTALIFYELYKDPKYIRFAHLIYERIILDNLNEVNIIEYRKGQGFILSDTLGMIIPFLVEYSRFTSNYEALDIAKRQMEYYIKYGIDNNTFLPCHGIHYESLTKVGSINWGRGIGWYLLGLVSLHKETNMYKKELDGIFHSLKKLKTNEDLFSQFPGSSYDFDASTSTMFYYSFCLANKENLNKDQIIKLFGKYIDKNGFILQTSGDTYGLNSYSKSFGKSELSQGMILLLLSIAKDNEEENCVTNG